MNVSARKIISIILAFTLLVVTTVTCLHSVVGATATNLLKNSGFETYSSGSFTDWSLWPGNKGNTQLSQVDGRTGKAAKIIVDNNQNIVNLYQSVTLEADKEYVFSAWIKLENIVRQWETAPGVYLSLSYNNNIPITKSQAINADTDWQKIEVTVDGGSLNGSEWAVLFDVVTEYVMGDIYVDDVSLTEKTTEPIPNPTPTPSGDEILLNNGFETFESNMFNNWDLWKGNKGNTQISQVDGRTGKAAKITVDNNQNIVNLYQSVTLEADKEYVFSAWIKLENIVRQWETAPGVYLSLSYNNNIPITKSQAINADTDWQKIEVTVDGSSLNGSEWAVLFDVVTEYVMGDIYIDDASVKVKEDDTPIPNPNPEPEPEPTPEPAPEPQPDPDENEPLKNKGFETFSEGSFEHWTLWKGNKGNTQISQVDGRTGKAAKITVDDNQNIVNLYQSVTLEADKQYVFSAWIKLENIVRQWETAPGVYLSLSYNNNIPITKSQTINADTDWQKIEVTVDGSSLNGSEWAVLFDVVTEYVMGDIYIDDASIKVKEDDASADSSNPGSDKVPTPELQPDPDENEPLKNRGFETFSDSSFKHWTLWKGNKGNTQISQVDGRTGKAAKITIDNNENIVKIYQEIELDPTKEYTFSVWVKTENIQLQWPGAQGVYVDLACNDNKILASESIANNSDWKKLEVVINGAVLQGDEWSVRFDISSEYLTGNIYLDDAELKETGNATPIAKPDDDELLKNNSFEIYSAGNFANWTTWKGNKGNTQFSQVDGRTGKAAKITVDNNNNIVNLYQEIELDPTKEYTFSVWVKTDNIALQWPGAQGVYLNFKYNNNVILMSKPVAVDSDWQKLEVVVNGGILKGDEWGVSLDIATEFLTGTIYVDDASVKVTGEGFPVPAESPDELLNNSSFELYSGYNFARWNLNKGNKGNTQLEQISKGRNGKAAKIIVDDNNNIVSLYQNITLDPAYEYTFSVWVRLENIELQWPGAEGVYLALGYNNQTPVRSKAIKTDTELWQKLELVVGGGDLKGDEWGVMFALTAEFLTGTIYVDDASMKITGKYQPKPDSFLQNGSFDITDEDTIIENWTPFSEDLFSVLDRNTDKAKEGTASASVFNSDGKVVSYWEQRVDKLDVTKTYVLSGYIFSDFIVSDNHGAATFVEFYDPEGNLIKTVRSDYVKGEQADWSNFELKLQFPENCVTMIVKAGLIKAVGTAYFDGFTLVEYDEKTHTAKEGVFENIYFMGITDDTDDTVGADSNEGLSLFAIAIIVGTVVILLCAGTVLFIIIRKRKMMVSDTKV